MTDELSPSQLAKLTKWLPEVICERDGRIYFLINAHNITWESEEVRPNQFDYLCRMAESKLTEVEQTNYVAVLWKNNQPKGFKGGYEWNQAALSQLIWWTLTHATPSQRIDALPEPKE